MKLFKEIISLSLFAFLLSACSDDDQGIVINDSTLLPYNAAEHIYGTVYFGSGDEWEVVISPSTGDFDTLPGTYQKGSSISYPNGTKGLTAFQQNERLFITDDRDLVVQDLTTFEYTTIDLTETGGISSVSNPQFLRFGANENELYILDTDDSLWKIDRLNNIVERKHGDALDSNDDYISSMYYIKADDSFLFSTNEVAVNSGTITKFILMDNDSKATLATTHVPEFFGLVQHPVNEKTFYCLKEPNAVEGFRLMEITVDGSSVDVVQKSVEDLPVESLSVYMQTIHTATNSYICRGGSNSVEMPTNILYSIDLATGDFIREADFSDSAIMTNAAFLIKLKGE